MIVGWTKNQQSLQIIPENEIEKKFISDS